jgi:hypothetical protein
MTKLAPSGTRSPMRDLTDEETSTYHRWAKVWFVVLFIALAIIVTVDLLRPERISEAITLEAIP